VVDPERARSVVESWEAYLIQHRDEITAIQLLEEAKERRIAFADIKQLADRISRPPHNWTPDLLWSAYETVHVGKVRHSDRHTLTDLVSLLRYTVGVDNELVPYADRVQERYAGWLAQQEQAGTKFSVLERWWLDRMVDVIATSAGIQPADLDQAPFTDKGGIDGALRDLGADRASDLLESLNAELTA
jgi:type I restriction enzyme R subunit